MRYTVNSFICLIEINDALSTSNYITSISLSIANIMSFFFSFFIVLEILEKCLNSSLEESHDAKMLFQQSSSIIHGNYLY